MVTNTSILRFSGASGDFVDTFVTGPGHVGFFALRFGPNGNLFVPNTSDSSVLEYGGESGELIRTLVAPGTGGLDDPLGLTFGPNGNLFVVSKDSNDFDALDADDVIEYDGATGALIGTDADLGGAGLTIPFDLVSASVGRCRFRRIATRRPIEE